VPTENHRRHILEEQTRSVYIIWALSSLVAP
jgi:hypothetical protein